MNSLCLVDAVGQNTSNWKSVSPWIREQILAYGMEIPEEGSECSLLYNAHADQSLEITTGDGADSFDACGARIPVKLSLGNHADVVHIKNTTGVKFTVDLGLGSDTIEVESAGDVDADLGDDHNTDVATVYYTDISPNIDGPTIYPIGDNNAKLMLNHWYKEDIISVHRDDRDNDKAN